MTFFTLLISNYRAIAIALMVALIALQTYRLSNAESRIVAQTVEYRTQIAVAEAKRVEVIQASNKTLERINHEHKALVEQAQKEASSRAYQHYFGVADGRGSLGIRLPISPGDGAGQDHCAQDCNGTEPSGIPAAFLADAVKAAVMIDELQAFVRGNPLAIAVQE